MRKTKLAIEVKTVTDLQGNRRHGPPYEGITGYIGWVPLIEIGQIMTIMDPEHYFVRLNTTAVQRYSYDEKSRNHTVRTKNSVYTLHDDFNPIARSRAKAPLYMKAPIKSSSHYVRPHPESYLLAYGRYPTKIHPHDLPEWYVEGYMYKRYGFMSARGVKHLFYKPNYLFNHLYKDDILFISYSKEIIPVESEDGFNWYEGYDYTLSGPVIVEFVDAVETYSGLDVSTIREELKKKKAWYDETYKSGDK